MFLKLPLSALLACAVLSAQIAVVNNASFRADQPVAAGSWAAAFGAFTGATTATATTFPLGTTLGGARVTVGGLDAPLYDVRATQITFLIPGAVEPGVRPIQVILCSTTISGTVRIIANAPGLFVKDAQLPPRGAVLNQDGVNENSANAPARRGEVVSLFGTGQGALSRAVVDGAVPGATPSLASSTAVPQVFIGGVEARVLFSGLNPGAPGLWQVNAVVPENSFIRGRVPVRIFLNGVDSNEVSIFVQP
ncbi:MAG: hypothetical protein K2X03_08000 [Bryobacteraceae bacterium]|nr:hypothetical protein [Bryobacteraceae bacterium]